MGARHSVHMLIICDLLRDRLNSLSSSDTLALKSWKETEKKGAKDRGRESESERERERERERESKSIFHPAEHPDTDSEGW